MLALSACASQESREEMPALLDDDVAGPASNDKLDAVAWTQGAAEFRAASLGAFAGAWRAVDAGIDDPAWDALPPTERDAIGNRAQLASLPIAVITDIDETLLDNTPFNARMIVEPIPGDLAVADSRTAFARRWQEWVADERARALPGAAAFAKRLSEGGIAFYYITNRDDTEREATCRNLVAEGFPVPDCEAFVLTRNDAQGRPSAKLSRRAMIGRGHRVLVMLGDNLGDFVDGVEATRAVRDALVDAQHAWWGERWFMLANPMYGSWENAAGPLPADAKPPTMAGRAAQIRAAKIGELDLKQDNKL
ncbi:MAG: HAD family acid phosphatase [Lysobacterales bacterium]